MDFPNEKDVTGQLELKDLLFRLILQCIHLLLGLVVFLLLGLAYRYRWNDNLESQQNIRNNSNGLLAISRDVRVPASDSGQFQRLPSGTAIVGRHLVGTRVVLVPRTDTAGAAGLPSYNRDTRGSSSDVQVPRTDAEEVESLSFLLGVHDIGDVDDVSPADSYDEVGSSYSMSDNGRAVGTDDIQLPPVGADQEQRPGLEPEVIDQPSG